MGIPLTTIEDILFVCLASALLTKGIWIRKMQRTIKFRAWDRNATTMYVVGDIRFYVDRIHLWDDRDAPYRAGGLVGSDVELMQYTGLKDKNGSEVWEGDIVFDEVGDRVEVVWDFQVLDYLSKCITEVIGNIYENPDLLERP